MSKNTKSIFTTREDAEQWTAENSGYLSEMYGELSEMDLENILRESNEMYLEDLHSQMDKQMDGIIVAYAKLGFWFGKRTGAKVFGDNLNAILSPCGCDDFDLEMDSHNVISTLYHHDGQHHLTYRMAATQEMADRILDKARNGELTYEYFRRNTKSILSQVKAILGW